MSILSSAASFNLLIMIVLLINLKYLNALSNDKDYYTSLVGLQKLAKSEQQILSEMLDYKSKLETRLRFLNSYLADYNDSLLPVLKLSKLKTQVRKSEFRNSIPVFENEAYLEEIGQLISSHPLLAYRILRRMAKELPLLMDDIKTGIDDDFKNKMKKFSETMRIPNIEDVEGAADGLLRIQDCYDFNVCDFVNGKLKDLQTNTELNAFDLNYIANRALLAKDFMTAIEFFDRALHRVVYEGDMSIRLDVIESHLQNCVEQHNKALKEYGWTEEFPWFSKPFTNNLTFWVTPKRPKTMEMNYSLYYKDDKYDDILNFKALCSGKILQPAFISKDLKCWYKKDSPSTILSPFKMELRNRNPPIVQIYDLISDQVINQLIQRASPLLTRSRIVASTAHPTSNSDYRTSSNMWIKGDMKNIPRLIYEATGLNATTGDAAEELQVTSYGAIGGHYHPHFDAILDNLVLEGLSDSDRFKGDRMATVMFYLSDVEVGGDTAFPRLGVATKAIKGSAVFWYNLKKNGNKDKLTLHGGCPVVYGNKWVANKWIRNYSQMFARPCGLSPDE